MSHSNPSTRRDTVLTLGGYCALFAVIAPLIAILGVRAWLTGGPIIASIRALVTVLGGLSVVVALCTGGLLGFLALHWLDDMKRYSALVLTVATGIALVVFARLEVFARHLDATTAGVFAFGVGLAVFVGGGRRLSRDDPPWQFPRAAAGLFLLTSATAWLSYLEVYVLAPAGTPDTMPYASALPAAGLWHRAMTPLGDAAAALLFVGMMFGLVTYEAREEFLVLGPPRSGKTTLQAGFYHVVDSLDTGQTRPNPSKPLANQYRGFLATPNGWGPLDEPTPNLEYDLLRFRYQTGETFAKYQTIRAFDTAGEHTDAQLADAVQTLAPTSIASVAFAKYLARRLRRPFRSRPEHGQVESDEAMSQMLATEVVDSDSVVFTLDAASLVEPETQSPEQVPVEEYLGTYETILTALERSVLPSKDVHVVVTKADHLRSVYAEYMSDGITASGVNDYESFSQFTTYVLRERDDVFPAVNGLFRMAPDATIHPVHYEIDAEATEEQGQPVPAEPVRVHGFTETLQSVSK